MAELIFMVSTVYKSTESPRKRNIIPRNFCNFFLSYLSSKISSYVSFSHICPHNQWCNTGCGYRYPHSLV